MSENDMFKDLGRILEQRQQVRTEDANKYREHDQDLCMLCHAYGEDKRSLHIACFYDVKEAVPEALDMTEIERSETGRLKPGGYYLRICKSCRARLLGHLREWRSECVALQDQAKDHDGYLSEADDPERNIPVRVDGAIVMLTREEWDAREKARNDT